MVLCLEGPAGLVEDQEGMMGIVVEFYKNLFAREERAEVSLSENFL